MQPNCVLSFDIDVLSFGEPSVLRLDEEAWLTFCVILGCLPEIMKEGVC